MVAIQTQDLIDAALDWAVAKCEGEDYVAEPCVNGIGMEYEATRYSTDWAQGGAIIERERINVNAFQGSADWGAEPHIQGEHDMRLFQRGPTPLIAAMRCFVASKLGPIVEVPEELVP